MSFTIAPIALEDDYGETILPLAAAKAHLRVEADDTAEDDVIAALRDAAIDFVEQYSNLRLNRVQGQAKFAGFSPELMSLGIGPAATFTVTGITYRPSAGAELIQLPAGAWYVDAHSVVYPAINWPTPATEVTITFEAGYEVETCPPSLLAAAKLMLGHLYSNRESIVTGTIATELPLGVRALCDRYRIPVL